MATVGKFSEFSRIYFGYKRLQNNSNDSLYKKEKMDKRKGYKLFQHYTKPKERVSTKFRRLKKQMKAKVKKTNKSKKMALKIGVKKTLSAVRKTKAKVSERKRRKQKRK